MREGGGIDTKPSRGTGAELAAKLAASLAPLLFAVPVVLGIAVSLVRLARTSDPTFGTFASVNEDAHALALGEALYQDPTDGYTGLLYTPGFPLLLSLIYRVDLWNGWAAVVTVLAGVALATSVAWLAYDPESERGRDRVLAGVGAVGIAALAWWLVSVLEIDSLYVPRPDQPAWALAILGLLATPAAARGSRRAEIAAVLLLTAAFWTKQPAVAAAVAAVAWIAVMSATGLTPRRFALRFAGGLVALNLAILGVANLLTDGWQWFFHFSLPARHPSDGLLDALDEFGYTVAPAAGFAAALWLLAGLSRQAGNPVRGGRAWASSRAAVRWLRAGSPQAQTATLLTIFAVVGTLLALYLRRKVGGGDNQYIGVVWALGLLGALAYRRGRSHTVAGVGIAGVVVVLFGAAVFDPVQTRLANRGFDLPSPRVEVESWPAVPAPLREYAGPNLVYSSAFPDLNVEEHRVVYPGYYNYLDLLAAGEQPTHLVRALLDRRFDAVALTPDGPLQRSYSAANGRWEENYPWKMNEVIRARYRAATGLPAGLLERRAGPEPAAWMRSCFGPFNVAGTELRIRRGGGFWCSRGAADLRLARTPAGWSEVVTTKPISAATGRLQLLLPRPGGAAAVAVGDGWRIEVRRPGDSGAATLRTFRGGRAGATHSLPAGRAGQSALAVSLEFAQSAEGATLSTNDGFRTSVPMGGGRPLSLFARRGSRAQFDLAGLRLREGS